MRFHLHVLLNRPPLEKTWVRSPEERVYLQQASDSMSLAKEFTERTENLEYTLHIVEDTPIKDLENMLTKPHSIILNLCIGTELDGLAGPSVTMFLEKLGLSYLGPSALFQTRTIDKIKMKEILCAEGIPTPNYRIITPNTDMPAFSQSKFPLRLRPADSPAPLGRNGMDLIVFTYEDFRKALYRLQTHFPLILVEEHKMNVQNCWFLIADGDLVGQSEESVEALALANTAYAALNGKGYAMIQVTLDPDSESFQVSDVITHSALLWACRILGKEEVIKYLNRGIQALCYLFVEEIGPLEREHSIE